MALWLVNTLIVTVLATVTVTLSSAMVAWGFAYFRFKGRNALFGLVLATMMLPGAVTMIPTFLIWNALGQVGHPHAALGGQPVRQRVLHLPAAPVLPRPAPRTVRRGEGGRRARTGRCSGGWRCRCASRHSW